MTEETPRYNATAEETPRTQSQRRQIVAFLLLAVLLAVALVAGVAYQQGAFSKSAEIYFIAEDVTGLAPGTTVRMSGFRIGKIASMHLQRDLTVKVTLVIEEEPFSHLRTDARANVIREQLKPAAIDLRAGVATAQLPAADPRVAFGRRGTLTEIADDLRAHLVPILNDIRQLTGVARERKGDIDALLQNAHAVSSELAGTAKQMHALSSELRQRVNALGTQSAGTMAEANKSLVKLGGLIGQAEKSLDVVNGRLPVLLGKSEDLLGHLDAVLRDTRTISSAAAVSLPPLLRGAPTLVDESRDMMQGLRQAWPLRTMLPAPPPALLPIDSHDSQVLRELSAR